MYVIPQPAFGTTPARGTHGLPVARGSHRNNTAPYAYCTVNVSTIDCDALVFVVPVTVTV